MMDIKTKINLIKDISILDIAGRLGIDSIADRCSRCINPNIDKKNNGRLEFNIQDNTYKCVCMNQTGDPIKLVEWAKNISRDKAIEWIYNEFIGKVFKA